MLITIIALTFFTALGMGGFFAMKKIQETDPRRADSSISNTVESSQDFLPFKEIKDGLIDVGNHQYRAIIECSSTNYNLKTEREKEVIEASFQRFVNSLSHPIWFFIQTRVMDNSKMLEELRLELGEVVEANPGLATYAEYYYEDMMKLNSRIGNNKQKKKYIIVPYGDAYDMPNLTEEEKYEYSKDELRQRALIIMSGLSSVGVKCELLDTEKLIELIHSAYHKDNYSDAEFIANGDFTTLIVDGKNVQQGMYDEARLDHILYEAQKRIMDEVIARAPVHETKEEFEEVVRDLNVIRDKYGAYYKSGR